MNYEAELKEKSFGYMIAEGSGYRHQILVDLSDAIAIPKQAVEEADRDNKILRQLLWSYHGHSGIYGDDGEQQCGECMLDYKRDSVEQIKNSLTKQSIAAATKYFEQLKGE